MVFGKLLMGTIRRTDSNAKLLSDLRPGATLLAQRGNLANVHDNLRTAETASLAFALRRREPSHVRRSASALTRQRHRGGR
jgi:hypothetical protein